MRLAYLGPAPLPAPSWEAREEARLAIVADYDVADSDPEPAFDHLVGMAASLLDVPMAMISIVSRDTQFFKARSGVGRSRLDLDQSFCTHALDNAEPLVVEDARLDPRFAANPLVVVPDGIRFYAGMPLRVGSGYALGTLCVVDREPRRLNERDRALLVDLARIVVDRLELRRSERKRRAHEEELQRLAHFDQLTGLPNRAHFYQWAPRMLANGAAATVLLFDLDGFKDINDVFGHGTGDSLLVAVGKRLCRLLAPGQLLARLGGDEFAVLLPGLSDPREAWRAAERLRASFREGFAIEGQDLQLDSCIGIALAPYHGTDIDRLLSHADLALYRAKERGAGSIGFYEPHLRQQVENRQALQGELRRAFETEQFMLLYQPQIRLADGALVGVEALLRWRHPEHGLLSPAQFLPVLELMPLAAKVGDWVLRTAIAQAARWARAGMPLRMGVNLAAAQFLSGSLPETVAAELSQNGLPASLLELEMTETVAVKNAQGVAAALSALRAQGVGIALDDFGTGYASLSLLRDFPVTRLKIDRDFTRELGPERRESAVVDAILRLGRAFNLQVVAEGVETEEQRRWLIAAGCGEGQGFHFGRPVEPGAIEVLARLMRTPVKSARAAGA